MPSENSIDSQLNRRKTSKRSLSGLNGSQVSGNGQSYPKGSILRVTMINFLTYTNVTVHPGPNLNMVIGPNGTGKSSIVCAICVAFAGKLELTGRSKSLSKYVRSGADNATVELELFDRDDGNIIIKRSWSSSSNASNWFLNGKAAKENDIKLIAEKYNIQIDNLCCYLPQNKVSTFAKLKPCELLRETERAVGNGHLLEEHDAIADVQSRGKQIVLNRRALEAKLVDLENKDKALQQRVNALTEYIDLSEQMRILKIQIARCDYLETRALKGSLDEQRKQKEISVQDLRKKYDTYKIKNEQILINQKELDSDITLKQKAVEIALNSINKVRENIENAHQKYIETERQLNKCAQDQYKAILSIQDHKESIKARKQELKVLKKELDDIGFHSNSPDKEYGALMKRLSELIGEQENLLDEKSRLRSLKGTLEDDRNDIQKKIGDISHELALLDDVQRSKQSVLGSVDRDCKMAFDWIQSNKNRFKGHVYNPLFMETNLKDSRYASALNSCLNPSDQVSFFCDNKEDYYTLDTELIRNKRLRISTRYVDPEELKENIVPQPLSQQELNKFGFQGYMVDFIECSDVIKNLLCKIHKLHTIPVSLKNVRGNIPNSIRSYASGNLYFRRFEGYNASVLNSTHMTSSKLLEGSVDTKKKDQLERELENLKMQIYSIDEELQKVNPSYESIIKKERGITQKREHVTEKLDHYRSKHAKYVSIESDIEQLEHEINKFKSISIDTEKEKIFKQELCNSILERVNLFKTLDKYNRKHEKCVSDLVFSAIKREKYNNDNSQGYQLLSLLENKIINEQNALDVIDGHYQDIKKKYKDVKAQFLHVKETLCTDDEKNDVVQIPQSTKTSLEMNEELAGKEARLRRLDRSDNSALQEKRENDVALTEVRAEFAEVNAKLQQLESTISSRKETWLEQLNHNVNLLSEKFSASFESINCRGKIELCESEDISQYSLKILVSFRENMPLEPLSYSIQSGGEKSVSTMMFLIALQSLTNSPFRVVDEINQGMDSTNERKVHNELVKSTSYTSASQYFLITPKLLPDLAFNEKMTVLCVFNGPYMLTDIQSEKIANSMLSKKRKAEDNI